MRFAKWLLICVLLVGACATPPDSSDPAAVAEYEEVNDPIEPFNRTVFDFNQFLDKLLFKPLAIFYRGFIPPEARDGVGNFLNNLKSPVVLINNFLQGDIDAAGVTFTRFLMNSTIGVAGFGDPASHRGWERRSEDFGQTLAVWGVPEGPYLILPFLGPSNPRDTTGIVVDTFIFDPVNWYIRAGGGDRRGWGFARTGMTALDRRAANFEEIDDLEKSSLDYYAALRSLYRQFRTSQIYNGDPPIDPVGPGFDDFPEDDGFGDEQPL
jgi:phospholipid-binding lipoprotein MlaA